MNELTEFLLARIAEDEAEARRNDDPRFYPEGWHPDHVAHVLADCEAKRRIVDRLSRTIDAADAQYEGPDYYGGVDACEFTLGALASTYADHPDYREEWRP